MATNIDKGLYAAPQGLEELAKQEAPIEIEIEDPESVKIGMDGLEVILEKSEEPSEDDFNANLAELLSDGELTELSGDLIGDFDSDIASRKDWIQTFLTAEIS